jgi:hypothetical protein
MVDEKHVRTCRSQPKRRSEFGRPQCDASRGMLRRLRDVALSLPVVITVNDCVATVARADAADLPVGRPEAGRASDGARGVPSGVGPSSSRGDDAAWVVLDRTATRLLNFARGDMVYLKTPSDPSVRAVRRLVALEGDWVTAADSDEVRRSPRGTAAWSASRRRGGSGDARPGTRGPRGRDGAGSRTRRRGRDGLGTGTGTGTGPGTAPRTRTTSTSSRWRCSTPECRRCFGRPVGSDSSLGRSRRDAC